MFSSGLKLATMIKVMAINTDTDNSKHNAVFIAILIGMSIAFFFLVVRGELASVTSAVLSREKAIARAQAANIEETVGLYADSVAALSRLPGVEGGGEVAQSAMDNFVDQHASKGTIGGIAYVDTSGTVILNSTVGDAPETGADVSDRSYFKWLEEDFPAEGEYYVGELVVSRFGSSEGRLILPVASPVFAGDGLQGLLVASVILDELTDNYAGLMMLSGDTDLYIVDQSGEVLYNRLGSDFSRSFLSEYDITKDGAFQDVDDSIVSFSPITFTGKVWLFVVRSSPGEIYEYAQPALVKQIATYALVMITVVLYWVFVVNKKAPDQPAIQPEDSSNQNPPPKNGS